MKCLATALGTLLLVGRRPLGVWRLQDLAQRRERPRRRRLEGRGICRDLSGGLGEASGSVRHQSMRLTPARGIAAA